MVAALKCMIRANGHVLDTKPDIKKLLFSGKSPMPAVDTAEETAAGISGRCKVGASEGRPPKRIKTEPGEAPVEGADRQGQLPGGAVQNGLSPGGHGPFVDVKPKLEPVEKAGGERAPESLGGMPPAGNKASLSSELHKASISSAGQPAGTTNADEDALPETGSSEPDPDEGLEEGEIEDVDARILQELEEQVRKHAELLKKKQEELERGAAGGGSQGPSQSQGLEAGNGSGPESRELVRAIGIDSNAAEGPPRRAGGNRQFWHAGEYEVQQGIVPETTGSMAHVRVHPKFLHSNATSHKWALGAVAELLDNALDEVQNGATFVSIDMELNPRAALGVEPMLVVEDDGGGMDPDRLRKCMSLGYSAKTKLANTIGQYGNGFKTSTMRLGADVIVFTRCPGMGGRPATQSIGLLSFTFLKKTGHEDIVVPMVDFEVGAEGTLRPVLAGSLEDHARNLDTICEWSPFATQEALLDQFGGLGSHGTRVVIFNLWENDDGLLELDFETDPRDILLRSRDVDTEKAEAFPDSHVYFTYMHSLRNYASILYLSLPPGFRIFLRGAEVQHHSLAHTLRHAKELLYRPHMGEDARENASVVTTLGFWVDSPPLDVQGFNVYHKNRLIKPFWRVWNSASSNGRGVVGVLEANFVEPAHDKQGFESTPVLQRLEKWLARSQKAYWNEYCVLVGYQDRATWKKRKPGSDPAYHAPSTARSPRDDPPFTPTEGGAGLDSPSVGDPGVSLAAPQETGGTIEGLDQEDQPLLYRVRTPKAIGGWQNGSPAAGAEEPRGSGGVGGPSPAERAETAARVKQLEAAVMEKDALLKGLEQHAGKLVEAVGERERRAAQLEAQLEEEKRTARLLDVAMAKLRGMTAACEQQKATIEQQRRALEVAERTAEALRGDVSREAARVAAAQKEIGSVRERGEAKVREMQAELNKERGWNGERALQLVKMEQELSAAREGSGAALAAERAAHAKAQEKLKLLARDHVHLRRQHDATLQNMAAQGERIEQLEWRIREGAEHRVKREPEPINGGEGEQEERRVGGERSGGEGGGALKKMRRTSDSSEVLEGGVKWPVAEERSVSHRSLAGEEDDLRAEMRRLKEEFAAMKELLLSKSG
ncbi:ATPase-like domain containing protein [Klebsormidium nitens]|uniref:ATPase-like domain containing protein n=1 Tax=Klebsormidium nitens TaxID=105231 RepID=A0A1Y1HWP5_KLENI|nr:ATPase-like domain containing protein [Klebsormidium nitens]|eukprot:GAQ80947.1 ATPase-like domain containing protein [Klebsormidium nitens]